MTTATPEGYRRNALGHLVPEDAISDIDKLRDDAVAGIVRSALSLQAEMAAQKHQWLSDVQTFCAISAEQHGVTWGGRKGNVSLVSYDGRYKVQLAVSDLTVFDEKLHIAKAMIDELILEWAASSSVEIKALVQNAFQTDKEGNINKGRIFELMRVEIDNPRWKEAMDVLRKSITPVGSAQYLRIYERVGDSDRYQQVALDMAGL